MTLYISLRSPFARRVRLALHRRGVDYLEKVIDVFHPSEEFLAITPLGLVPTLVTPQAGTLSDSNMILEWIHQNQGPLYSSGPREWPERQTCIWIHGLTQAIVAFFQETKLHDAPSRFWSEDHHRVVEDTLQYLNGLSEDYWLLHNDLTQAGWDLCVALEYLDLRMPHLEWRKRFSHLEKPLLIARQNSKFVETSPPA